MRYYLEYDLKRKVLVDIIELPNVDKEGPPEWRVLIEIE